MRFDLGRTSLCALLLAGTVFGAGCAPAPDAEEEISASTDPIVDIGGTAVKRQAVGNCWLYAGASWAESLVKQATGEELNMSESYWTYWHWFDQIANGRVGSEIQTGGWFSTAVEIMARYGIVSEEAFIPAEATEERSLRQKAALTKINESLKTGVLSSPEARRDRAVVRQELDLAFELDTTVVEQMDTIFRRDVTRTLDRSSVDTKATMIRRPVDFSALLREPETHEPHAGTLEDAIGTRSAGGSRTGKYMWRQSSYPFNASSRRTMLARVQRAMHDGQPVVMSWHVDFAAMKDGQFLAPPETPGAQGGHMVIVEDYQVADVPGFGTLTAGVAETRPEALEAALSPESTIEFIRIKNSWGTHRPDPLSIGPGSHDLYMRYLDGPIKQCTQENGTSTDRCWDDTPLNDFVLPAGY
jgi:hypothetical protein